ncbi:MAG TPA: glycosyltransferase family 4 protein [Ktedonobacterales bacterium]|nr:glycosyltransferase family 4 protein [Ktedonobacterales bacterium]
MKILVVAHSLPRPTWGAGTRNYHLLRALAQKHSVSLLALVPPDEREQSSAAHLRSHTRHVRQVEVPQTSGKRLNQLVALAKRQSYLLNLQMLPAAQAALDEELARHAYDAVLFEGLLVAGYRVPQRMRVILDEHNIEHELIQRSYQAGHGLMRRGFNWMEYRRLKPQEIDRCRRADLVLVTSEREQHLLQGMLPEKNVRVVPNGVDIQAFAPDPAVAEIPGRLVFTASFDYYPNVQGALHFADNIWPRIRDARPDATWHLVGRNPPPEIQRLGALPGVTVTGSVPKVQPHLAAAQVAIVPLLTGAGTRLKILEAMAMRRAIVSTALGCEGLDCISGEHLLVADEPEKFAATVVYLLDDAPRRASLGHQGRVLVEERYSWDYCGSQLLAALDATQENGWRI